VPAVNPVDPEEEITMDLADWLRRLLAAGIDGRT
jgi:hypothetical protein